MEISTKYNIGDNVFTLSKESKIVERTIERVSIFAYSDEVRINYTFTDTSSEYETMCFPSKEALLEYIQS